MGADESDDPELPARQAEDGEAEGPIVDPMAGARATEVELTHIESFRSRALWLERASYAAGGLSLVLLAVSLFGRSDPAVLVYLGPIGILNLAFGVMLRRATNALTPVVRDRARNPRDVGTAFGELHKAFGLLLLSAGFLVVLMLAALALALVVQRSTEI
ncbi:MAG: hypothetical protein U0263_19200 [Polyangiaceae bacterium]